MRAKYKLTNPADAEATLSLTMTIGEWTRLREQLADSQQSGNHPAWKVGGLISDLLKVAQKEFEAEGEF